jgi:anti-anti-sigma regulatory factor/putative methionine-R-sulfoxide reductase with GAF domain
MRIETELQARSKEQLIDDLIQARARIAELEALEAGRSWTKDVLRDRNVQLQAVAEVGQVASSILDVEALIRQSVDLIREHFNLYYVGLFLLDEAEAWAVLRAGTGEAGAQMLAQNHRLKVGGASMIGQCVALSEARIALDVGREAVRFDNPALPETRSEMALPLRSRGRVLGALSIQSVEEAAFDDASIAIYQTMADQLAVAIDNAGVYTSLQAELAERERMEAERERLQQEVIDAQQRAIRELSTPIIPVMKVPDKGGIIVMPLIGSIDSMRARDIMRALLAGIGEHQAKEVIIDITGVPVMDTGVAGYLNKTMQAARLKGARVIITGISEVVAETIVDLGIDWGELETLSDLQTGLVVALRRLGIRLIG